MNTLADLRSGRRGAVAKAITTIENDPAGGQRLIKQIFAQTGNSVKIGITGPAGAGKSSLINKVVGAMNKLGANPAVLAVDPTSHVTGGAILGDRVRMTESTDSGTYIRSIASRGATGAVSSSLRNSIRVLEYAGFDPIIIESVGAGQTEVEISRMVDITVVVFNPNTGDNIQAIKAGLTEIGDLYVIHKSDLAGADRLFDAVRDFIVDSDDALMGRSGADARQSGPGGRTTILKTSIKKGATITKLARTLVAMAESAGRTSGSERRLRLKAELRDIIIDDFRRRVDDVLDSDLVSKSLDRLSAGKTDPYTAGKRIAGSLLK